MMFRTTCLIAVSVLVVLRVAPGSKYVLNATRYLMTSESGRRPVIYTYNDQAEEEMLKLWKEKWYAAGWDPVVLTIENAKSHRAYASVLKLLPKGRGIRVLHWLSISQAGGGWLSEHDVFPLHDFTHDALPNGGTLTFWESVVPSLVSGSSAEFARGAHRLAETVQGDGKHSDILALVQLSRSSPVGQQPFLKERKVISVSRAIESNATICFDGKRAIHFADYKSDDMKSIVNWLDEWAESNCSDLPKRMIKTEQNDKQLSPSVKNQQLVTFVDENVGMQQVSQGSVRGSAQARTQQLQQQVSQITTFDKYALTPEAQSPIFPNHQLTAPHLGPQILSASRQKVPRTSKNPQQKQVLMPPHGTTATEANLRSAAQAPHQKQEPTQNNGIVTTEEQLRYLPNNLPEAGPKDKAEYIANSQQDTLSPEDQVRLLRKRGILPSLQNHKLEWSEMLRAASMDENLVHQLAKGDRRTAQTAQAPQHKQEPAQNQEIVSSEEQLRYLPNNLPEAGPKDKAKSIANSQQDTLSPGDQARLLLKREILSSPQNHNLEWSEMLRAASTDENLVHQLTKGDRRTADQVSFPNTDLSSSHVQQQGGSHQKLQDKEVVGQTVVSQRTQQA